MLRSSRPTALPFLLLSALAFAAAPAAAGGLGDVGKSLRTSAIEREGSAGTAARSGARAPEKPWVPVKVDLSSGLRVSNKTTAKLVDAQGKVTGESIGSSTTDHLVDLLQRAVATGRRITNLEIKGHGAPELQQMGADTFLVVAGKSVLVHLRDGRDIDIAPLLRAALADTAVVNLNSCKSGRGDDSVAQNMSRCLPGRLVSGGSLYQMSIPFTSKAFGTKKYFRDGELVKKRWYNID